MKQNSAYAATEYREEAPESESALLAEIYDGIFVFLAEAHDGFVSGDESFGRDRVHRASRVVVGLRSSLAVGHSAQVTRDLDYLYAFCLESLARAHRDADAECVTDVMRILRPLREAWEVSNRYEEKLAG